MKVPHGQIESCRADPVSWVRRRLGLSGDGIFATRGFNAGLRDAICEYHRVGSPSAAHEALSKYIGAFKDENRKQENHDRLDNYIFWHKSAGIIVAHTRIRLVHPMGNDVLLGGDITRLDMDPLTGRYAAVLLTDSLPFDNDELRWPLIQLAIARQFARDADLISVGVQDLAGGQIGLRSFSASVLALAEAEAQELSSEIQAAIAALSHKG